ncbi:bifunctional DNA primase/polymerase [Streptomyces sp. NPDC059861]|uniref:bifunctional DNA primase/polymerase n=1 Tax=Streptomyces sp. NPDC059861 TaxID=3346974 RepID=UPI00365FA401
MTAYQRDVKTRQTDVNSGIAVRPEDPLQVAASGDERHRILDAAERLLERGFHVFACDHPDSTRCACGRSCDAKQRGKHPAGRWKELATNSLVTLGSQMTGLRNIAVACGPSALVVIDEDVPGALETYASEAGEEIPNTFRTETGKGTHFYFSAPEERLGNGLGQLRGRGIDVRGAGGYVIAPGSRHQSGRIYEASDWKRPVAQLPAWLEGALRASPMPNSGLIRADAGTAARAEYGGDLWRLVLQVLTVDMETESRHGRLHWAACRAAEDIAAGYYDETQARQALAAAGVDVGLDERDARDYVRRALRWGRDHMGAAA